MDYRPNWIPWNPAQGRPFAAVLIFVPGRRNGHSEGDSPCTNYIPGSWKRFPSGSRGAQYPNILLNEIVLLPSHQLPEEPSKSQPFGSASGWSRTGAGGLPGKPAEKRLFPRVAVYFRDGLGQGNALGTSMNAVLRVGALLDATRTHERR